MANNRLLWADALKGVLALVVIFGHALQFSVAHPMEDYVWNIIYSVHMPAFFAISGFVAFRPGVASFSWWKVIFRRFQQLIIPFLVWSLIDFVTHSYGPKRLLTYVLYPDCMYWFLWALFFICVLFTTIDYITKKLKISIDIPIIGMCLLLAGIMVVFNIRQFGFQFIAYYFLFYVMGYFMRKYDFRLKNKYILVGLGVVWLFLAFYWRLYTAPTFVPENSPIPSSLWMYSYRFIVATIGIIVLLSVFANMNSMFNSESKMVKLGTYSLGSYVVQLLLIHFVIPVVKKIFVVSSDVTIVTVSFAVTTIVAILAIMLFKKNKITALLFLGKVSDKQK